MRGDDFIPGEQSGLFSKLMTYLQLLSRLIKLGAYYRFPIRPHEIVLIQLNDIIAYTLSQIMKHFSF
jgi:hypothetical protein